MSLNQASLTFNKLVCWPLPSVQGFKYRLRSFRCTPELSWADHSSVYRYCSRVVKTHSSTLRPSFMKIAISVDRSSSQSDHKVANNSTPLSSLRFLFDTGSTYHTHAYNTDGQLTSQWYSDTARKVGVTRFTASVWSLAGDTAPMVDRLIRVKVYDRSATSMQIRIGCTYGCTCTATVH